MSFSAGFTTLFLHVDSGISSAREAGRERSLRLTDACELRPEGELTRAWHLGVVEPNLLPLLVPLPSPSYLRLPSRASEDGIV